MSPAEFQDAVNEHLPRVHRAALVLCGNPWDADDLVQETFLIFSRSRDKFEGRSRLYTWLYGILLNVERRARRRMGVARRKLRVVWNEDVKGADSQMAGESPLEVREWKKSLWSLVAKLPEGQRQAMVLRFSEGLRYEEIGEALECPVGTVKSRMHHGLLTLRAWLAVDGSGMGQLPNFPNQDVNDVI